MSGSLIAFILFLAVITSPIWLAFLLVCFRGLLLWVFAIIWTMFMWLIGYTIIITSNGKRVGMVRWFRYHSL